MRKYYSMIALFMLGWLLLPAAVLALPPTVTISSVTPAIGWSSLDPTINYSVTGACTVYLYVDGVEQSSMSAQAGNNQWFIAPLSVGNHTLQLTAPGGQSSVSYTVDALDEPPVSSTITMTEDAALGEFYDQQNHYNTNDASYIWKNAQLQQNYGITYPQPMIMFSALPFSTDSVYLSTPRLTADAVYAYAKAYRYETDSQKKASYDSLAQAGANLLMCVQSLYSDNGGILDDFNYDHTADLLSTADAVRAFWQCYESFGSSEYYNAAIEATNWIYNHPAYPFTRNQSDPYQWYSVANILGAQINAEALTYEYTGLRKYLDDCLQGAEELMAWQNFTDIRDPWGKNGIPNTAPGGWYYCDYKPDSLPAGDPEDANTYSRINFNKYMHYHTTILDGLIAVLEATGYQYLPWEETQRDNTSFVVFKNKLVSSIMRGLEFMIENQYTGSTTSGGPIYGLLSDCDRDTLVGAQVKGGGLYVGDYDSTREYEVGANFRPDAEALHTLVKAYEVLSQFSTVSNSDLQKVSDLFNGIAHSWNHGKSNYFPGDSQYWDDPEWYLLGQFRNWSSYAEYLSTPISRTLTLVNACFNDQKIRWEFNQAGQQDTVFIESGTSYCGSNALQISDNSTSLGAWGSELLSASPNNSYTATAYAYMLSGNGMALELNFLDKNFQLLSYVNTYVSSPNGGFQPVSVTGTAPSGASYVAVMLVSNIATVNDGYWDDVSISSTSSQSEKSPQDSTKLTIEAFPNPSNPFPEIHYSIGMKEHVRVDVFDVLGRRVETLVNANEEPGQHEVLADKISLSSGVYFCRIEAGPFYKTTKFIILK